MRHVKPCAPSHTVHHSPSPSQSPSIQTQISSGYELIKFRPYHYEYRDGKSDKDTLQIISWAMNQKSESVLVRIEDFPAFCFVELPSFIGQTPVMWDSNSASMFVSSLQKRFKDNSNYEEWSDGARESSNDDCDLLNFNPSNFGFYKKMYYFCGNYRNPMVRLTFKTTEALNKAKNILNYMFEIDGLGSIKANVWESEIDPVRKFLSAVSPDLQQDPERKQELTFSCWTQCLARRVHKDECISNNQYEYIIDWTTIKRIPDEECNTWLTYPGTMAFDIECYCNRHQMFPDKHNDSHVAYMISCTYERLESTPKGQKPLRYRYGIILGDCNNIPEDEFANTILFPVNTEEELVRMMGAIILYHDPEIITGYNILSFDYPYLNARLGRTGNSWPRIGKLKGEDCYIKNNTWSSGAYGHNDINMLICSGRLSIDMLSVIRRDYKMSTYGLNAVSKKFVNKEKHDITAKEMFVIYEKMIQGLKAGKGTEEYDHGMAEITRVMLYCIQDSELVLDIMNATHWWLGAVEMSNIVGVNIIVLSTGGQQQRCESQLYHMATKCGYILNSRVAPQIPFEGGAVQPPTPGRHRWVLTIDFTSLYPSIMRWKNICYTTLINPNTVNSISDEMCNTTPPINACNTFDPEDDDDEDDDERRKERVKAGGEKGTRVFKYVKKEVLEGLVPRIVGYLCNERNRVKKMISDEYKKGDDTDQLQLVVLDKRQNGLKVSANSFFGFLGVREGGKRPLIEGAMSTTAWGREMITLVIEFLKKKYNADIIYGDTDSAMVCLPQIKKSTDVWYWGQRIAEDVTKLFGDPVNMEFEKAFAVMISLKKKKYVGILCDMPDKKKYGLSYMKPCGGCGYCTSGQKDECMDGEIMFKGPDKERTSQEVLDEIGNLYKKTKSGEPDLFIRGVLTARRDNCAWARNIYNEVITDIIMDTFHEKNDLDIFKKTINKICDYAEPLIEGKIPAEDLCINRALGSNYKSNTYFMKVFSDELRREGTPAQPGDRLEYLVMKRPGVEILGKRMMLKETYGQKIGTDKEEPIDYGYYLEKQIQNHIDQVVSISFKDIIDKLFWLKDRPNKRCKFTDLNEVVKLIVRMSSVGKPIKLLREAIDDGIEDLKNPPEPQYQGFYIVDEQINEPQYEYPSFYIEDDVQTPLYNHMYNPLASNTPLFTIR